MNSPYRTEVLSAAFAAIKPADTLISRRSIETEIEVHPGLYPVLSGQTRIGRRTSITRVMNTLFPPWSTETAKKPYSNVWKVRAHIYDTEHTGGEA
ncbi:hypothetical protein ACKUB1_11695 [Methanospirillum stamsii]|uniref:Uncharacterized protein n=1 Tax=Methanospirillum stamsii TaxID=1277351 RepID=A0A2V2NCX9_9EURY|nr:hypothetical protein [Methanospirillum stamsii]PWR73153.1 hypothetical protein DLD82_11295 [Methanospirillum stamsii]